MRWKGIHKNFKFMSSRNLQDCSKEQKIESESKYSTISTGREKKYGENCCKRRKLKRQHCHNFRQTISMNNLMASIARHLNINILQCESSCELRIKAILAKWTKKPQEI